MILEYGIVNHSELLRIKVPNLECLCVNFMNDGKSIISGWSDGKIRAFKPRSGKLIYAINDAHRGGVTTAITSSKDCLRIISGGQSGRVRVWKIGKETQIMIASMKEHKNKVTSVSVSQDDLECVSASTDGSCIVWDLERFTRNTVLFASSQFQCIRYHPDQSQLLTTGTDRKLTYWDVIDGEPIRIINGAQDKAINTLYVSYDGGKYVTGGNDKLVKLYGYDNSKLYAIGYGHSGGINQVTISDDQKYIASVGNESAIFLWKYPYISEIDDEIQQQLQYEQQIQQEALHEIQQEQVMIQTAQENNTSNGILNINTGQIKKVAKPKIKAKKVKHGRSWR